MFEIGDYVVYGNKGVCQVKNVGPISLPGVSKDKLYYTMDQVFLRGSTIFTPVDGDKLRGVMTKNEAESLIADIVNMRPVWNMDDKERERRFTEILRNADSRELCEMIIVLFYRREERIAGGKKATTTDERYLHAAEDILYGELIISLGLQRDEIKKCIFSQVRC